MRSHTSRHQVGSGIPLWSSGLPWGRRRINISWRSGSRGLEVMEWHHTVEMIDVSSNMRKVVTITVAIIVTNGQPFIHFSSSSTSLSTSWDARVSVSLSMMEAFQTCPTRWQTERPGNSEYIAIIGQANMRAMAKCLRYMKFKIDH